MAAPPGGGWEPPAYGQMRASQADRERGVDVLKAAFAEGRLDQDEYADRVGRLYASKTYGEIAMLTADLPVGPLGLAPPAAVPPPAAFQPPVPWARLYPEYPPYPAGPVVPARDRADNMALASFLFGLGSFVTAGIAGVPAVVLGSASLLRIRRTGRPGTGLAITGIVLGIAGWVLLISMIASQMHR